MSEESDSSKGYQGSIMKKAEEDGKAGNTKTEPLPAPPLPDHPTE